MNIFKKKPKWFEEYPAWTGWSEHVELLSKYENEKDFTDQIPYELQLNISKITLHEACVWKEYQTLLGIWPRIKQIMDCRRMRGKRYVMSDLFVEDNYGEHF